MAKLKKYQMGLNKEDKQSESLAYKRRKEEVEAVEQMLNHPMSSEEIDKQIKRNTPGTANQEQQSNQSTSMPPTEEKSFGQRVMEMPCSKPTGRAFIMPVSGRWRGQRRSSNVEEE